MTRVAFDRSLLQHSRFRSLDGLRGLASLVVLGYHAALISPTFSAIVFHAAPPPNLGWFLISSTPLRLLIAGNEAVFVFFVLSGFVLALQVLRRDDFDWYLYYPRRLVRLYVPVLASIALAAILTFAFQHHRYESSSIWVQLYTYPQLDWVKVLSTADLLGPSNPDLNSPLWSLRWEIVFSLLLPVYVFLIRKGRRVVTVLLVATPVIIGLGLYTQSPSLVYLPMFFVGGSFVVLLMSRRPDTVGGRGPTYQATWIAVLLISLALLCAVFLFARPLDRIAPGLSALVGWIPVAGAAGLVLVAARWAPAVRLLESPLLTWLGRLSFSLYLVHAPILLTTANLLHALPWPVSVGVGVAVSFGVAELFSRFAEQPSHRLSRRIGLGATAAGAPT